MNILNLPQLNVLDVKHNEHGDYHIKVETNSPPSHCPNCGFSNLYKHGTKKQLFMDLTMHGKRVGIVVERQRYLCRECNNTFFEPLPDMDEKRLATKRLVEWIEKQSLERTFVSIADEIGLHEKTIRNIFKDYVQLLEDSIRFETPVFLGIDEIYIIKKPRCILTNIDEHTVIDMLSNRNKETVVNYLFRLPNRDKVEVVAMDMWNPYRDAVKAVMPQATIIIDKYHVVRMANVAMEDVRKKLRSQMDKKQRRGLMHDRKILLKRHHDLLPQHLLVLDLWLANYPVLKTAYDLKEGFFKIWDHDNLTDAYKALQAWKDGITDDVKPSFQPILTALNNWEEEIFNYFIYRSRRITNAYTESLNSIVRMVNNLGRGYSFEALRAKILYTRGFHKVKRTSYRNTKLIGRIASQPMPDFNQMVRENEDPEFNLGVDISTLAEAMEKGLI